MPWAETACLWEPCGPRVSFSRLRFVAETAMPATQLWMAAKMGVNALSHGPGAIKGLPCPNSRYHAWERRASGFTVVRSS